MLVIEMCCEGGQTVFHSRFRVHAPVFKINCRFLSLNSILWGNCECFSFADVFMLTGIHTSWCHLLVCVCKFIIICMHVVYICDCAHVEVRVQLSGSPFSLHSGFLGSNSGNQPCAAGPFICSAILLACFFVFETKTHCGMAGLYH